jgi:hypothetical protein
LTAPVKPSQEVSIKDEDMANAYEQISKEAFPEGARRKHRRKEEKVVEQVKKKKHKESHNNKVEGLLGELTALGFVKPKDDK